MATDVFDLYAKLGLDTSPYEEGLAGAEKQGAGFGKGLASAAKVGVAAVAAVGTAAIGAGTAIVSGASKVAEYGDNVDKMSQKIGISAEAYQEWDAVLQHSGASVDSLKAVMKTLSTQATKNAEEFQQLGISEEELATLSKEDLFARVVEGLQGMEEGTERTAVAAKLLGRGATEFGALLNTSAEDTQEMKDRVRELGGVMSNEAVKASAQFKDSLQDLTTGFDGLKRNLMSDFVPSLTTVMDGLTAILSGDMDAGVEKMSDGIQQVIDNVSKLLPRIIEVAVPVLEAIVGALIDNLPTIMPALTTLVMGISDMIVQNLPFLIDTAMQMILTIAQGIAESLPTLIPTIVDVILQIVDTLIDNIDLLIDASIAIMIGLTEGLIEALPRLLEKAPIIIQKLVDALIRNTPKLLTAALEAIVALVQGIITNLPQILTAAVSIIDTLVNGVKAQFSNVVNIGAEIIGKVAEGIGNAIEGAKTWGADLIDNFISGITGGIGKVTDAVGEIGEAIADFIGFSEPDKGPLSRFHTFAPDMIDLFTQGIDDNLDEVKRASEAMAAAMEPDVPEYDTESVPVADAKSVGGADETLISSLLSEIQKIIKLLDDKEQGETVIPIYIGNKMIDELVLDANRRIRVKSGGFANV